MATISNLYIDQGSDFSAVITLTDQTGSVMDITGYTVQSQFRKSYQSSSFSSFVVSIMNAQQGKIQLSLPANTSSAINAGRYLYDIEIARSNEKKRVLEGIVVLAPEITR